MFWMPGRGWHSCVPCGNSCLPFDFPLGSCWWKLAKAISTPTFHSQGEERNTIVYKTGVSPPSQLITSIVASFQVWVRGSLGPIWFSVSLLWCLPLNYLALSVSPARLKALQGQRMSFSSLCPLFSPHTRWSINIWSEFDTRKRSSQFEFRKLFLICYRKKHVFQLSSVQLHTQYSHPRVCVTEQLYPFYSWCADAFYVTCFIFSSVLITTLFTDFINLLF